MRRRTDPLGGWLLVLAGLLREAWDVIWHRHDDRRRY